ADDRVLERIIHNLATPPIIEIRGYLQEARFLHMSCMLGSCKLDPTLIIALVERWRPDTHTFHLLYTECTITLEDVAFQLGLPVDRTTVTRSAIVLDKEDLCTTLLGKVQNLFEGSQIRMKWLETNLKKLASYAIEVVKEQYSRVFFLRFIGAF
ncbi:hypothetical protein Golob_026353, partial [Gossypium lobatum]|nr:hypothetical protein [Gossypium lobatum]